MRDDHAGPRRRRVAAALLAWTTATAGLPASAAPAAQATEPPVFQV